MGVTVGQQYLNTPSKYRMESLVSWITSIWSAAALWDQSPIDSRHSSEPNNPN